ncbi:MAG: chemotaxis protein CheW [Vulcanibacillus sp.]
MDMNQYMNIFIDEAKEHLIKLNEWLLKLENEPNNNDIINEIFRSAHTLKGSAATMGFEKMATLTHEMENLLDLVRNRKITVNVHIIDLMFKCLDVLDRTVNSISTEGNDNVDSHDILLKVKEITNSTMPIITKSFEKIKSDELLVYDQYETTLLEQSIENGYFVNKITVTIHEETALKSVRAFMVLNEVEKFGDVVKIKPSIEDLENGNFDNVFTLILISREDKEVIKKAISNISEITSVNITLLFRNDIAATNSKEENILDEVNNLDIVSTNSKKFVNKMVRVDITRLDELMNLFSELIIDRGQLEKLGGDIRNSELTNIIKHINRITTDLQNNILNLRMVPVEQVFNRFPRMVRDLSKDLNKKVELNIIGSETELDRTVIDEIGDPLVHLIRNAIDHGLESTEDRIRNNKPETGTITLKAYHSGNYILIEISDDGRGIDIEKTLKLAVERKFLNNDDVANISKEGVYNILFKPGFSTAKKVTDVSGRGVGLDVVKNKIESLGGFISIESDLGKGTVFTIQLPLTLSIISSMLVSVQGEEYSIPLSSIVETAVYSKSFIKYAQGQEVIDFRGTIVPIIYLDKIFKIPKITEVDGDEIAVVLVKKRDQIAGLVVDSFIGQQEIVLKSLGSYLKNIFAISGATILGDGQVALIIDTNALIR